MKTTVELLPPRKKRQRPPKITETQEHLVVASYFKRLPLDGHAMAFHLRGERAGHMARIVAAKMGVMPKLPDWQFLDGRGGSGFIELKERGWTARTARTGTYTDHERAQMQMHEFLRSGGYWVEVCETLEEVLETLRARGFRLRTETVSTARIKRGFANKGLTA